MLLTIDDDNHRGYRVLTDFTCSDYLSFISSSVFFLKKFSEKFAKKFKKKTLNFFLKKGPIHIHRDLDSKFDHTMMIMMVVIMAKI